jgi:hypothetical protein
MPNPGGHDLYWVFADTGVHLCADWTRMADMRYFLQLLLALSFLLYSVWVPAASLRHCCPERDCPATQCADLGCAQGQSPQAPLAELSLAPPNLAASAVPARPVAALPAPVAEVWTPPD